MSVTVSRVDDRLVAVKTASSDGAERLRAEAQVLEALDHPGLVQFIDMTEANGLVSMRTAFAGADTWATRPTEQATERAAGIAAVAATLADLHARGVSHGSLDASHVIRGDQDRPVLCSLARTRGDDLNDRQADLIALADLIDMPPLPSGPRASAMTTLANRIRSGRCEATDVVDHANHIAAESGHQLASVRRTPRRLTAVISVVALAAAATAIFATVLPRSPRTPLAPAPVDDPADPASSDEPIAPSVPATGPNLATPGPIDETSPGVVLDHGGRRYRIGRPGDIVVVGDWDCDGTPTPAVLRPATGDIGVFNRWPDPDHTIEAPSSWVFDDALDLAIDTGSDCDRLRVHTAGDSRLLDIEGVQ